MKRPGGTAIVVIAFRFVGNTLLGAERLTPAVSAYLNRPLDFAQLQAAVSAIATAYREAGWVVRAYLPEQDIVDGIVTIRIVEAVFGGVRHEGQKPSRVPLEDIVRLFDVQQKTGEPLNANAIDRALLLAEDMPGVTVSGSLRKGANEGESELALKVADTPILSGESALDDTGSRSTGRVRLAVNLALESPLGFGEKVSLNGVHSQGSDYLLIGGNAPLGADGWRVGASSSHMTYKLVAPEMVALKGQGSSNTLALNAIYPVIRSRLNNLYFNASLDHKAFDNLSMEEVTTRYKIDSLTLGLNGNLLDRLGGGGANSASASLVNGNVNLDGSPNQAAVATTTRTAGRFSKFQFSASRQQVISSNLAFYASLSGQIAGKNLDSSEKFYLGGSSGVRAYPVSEAGGSEGKLVSLELRWRLPEGFSLTGFFDYGQVTVNRNNNFTGASALNSLSLRGAGMTLARYSASGFGIKGTLAQRIGNNPNPTATGNDQDGSLIKNRVWLSASLPF